MSGYSNIRYSIYRAISIKVLGNGEHLYAHGSLISARFDDLSDPEFQT